MMLTEKKIRRFKELLTERLNELSANGSRDSEDNGEPIERCPDPADRATAEWETDFNLRMRERERGLLEKIQEALERIENGTYGICEECEEEISEGRLMARPVTTLCIKCKRKEEAEEKRKGL